MQNTIELFSGRFIRTMIFSAGAAALLPFFLLCYYTLPGYIDDYGIAVHIQAYGWQFVPYYLKVWNGRFVAAFFHWFNPLGYRLPELYGLTALFLLSFFGVSAWIFIRSITKQLLNGTEQLVLWTVFLIFFFSYVRTTVDLFYWYSSGATYCIAICWQLLYMSLLPKLFVSNPDRWAWFGLPLLGFLQAGTNEVVAATTFIIATVLLIVFSLRNRKYPAIVVACSLGAIFIGIFLQIVLSDSPRS
ncbi:hypothetical protein [Rhodoflexus sp.]